MVETQVADARIFRAEMRAQVAVAAADVQDRAVVQVGDFGEDVEADALARRRLPAERPDAAAAMRLRLVAMVAENSGLIDDVHEAGLRITRIGTNGKQPHGVARVHLIHKNCSIRFNSSDALANSVWRLGKMTTGREEACPGVWGSLTEGAAPD